ncbi:DUF1715-domain-containing protein [Cenococcum geophilum 1.58]|uniref:DUF1715-domain-containing protein n=1 Tax=Cenococcum geophilum 1.58 TaxID=794803 RepID=UPI00358E53F5|nr:DUF1715-domain-containing protein [Cenococcum geophilum 1.58]
MEDDPFESVLDLEETYYQEGYDLGVADGSRAGRIEGRVFGIEKGFEKFAAMGMLHGRAAVWASRLPRKKEQGKDNERKATIAQDEVTSKDGVVISGLPPLAVNPRLERHIQTLFALVEPDTFSTENTEESVADFDDRLKRAGAKAKVIERIVGEGDVDDRQTDTSPSASGTKDRRVKVSRIEKTAGNMEDFGDRRFLS